MLPLLAGIEGPVLTPRERELFTRLQPAGYILFTRNITDVELVRELTDELRQLSSAYNGPIIAIDQEGGRVVRTAAIGVEAPSAAELAATQEGHLITQAAIYCARCLHSLGVNTNFAPVLDLSSPHANALPSRCWGADVDAVISYAGMWNRELYRQGILSCGKHFPGMGGASVDPHHDLPLLGGTRESFCAQGAPAIPFTALMPELPSLMIAHLLIEGIDAQFPSSLSYKLVQEFLREQLGYEGLVFTDDLCMGAIAKLYSPVESCVLALNAGCDVPLICHDVCEHLEAIANAIENMVPATRLDEARTRIERFMLQSSPCPAMPFIAWNEYLRDNAAFKLKVPAIGGAGPGSPVAEY